MTDLEKYLSSLNHLKSIKPLNLTIKNQTYEACIYTATFDTPEGSLAYKSGERIFIYCLGQLPNSYKRSTHIAFDFEGDPHEWYIAGYWPVLKNHKQNLSVAYTEYHPFGPNFLLSPWDNSDPIDLYEKTPYQRIRVTIEH